MPDAVRALSPEAITALREPAFTFAGRQHPILWGSPAEPLMRYYRTQLDEDVAAGAPLAPRHRMAVDELDAVLADLAPRCQFRLEAGEMILINNIRALHGRTALEDDSARLMYRFRVHAGCLYPPN